MKLNFRSLVGVVGLVVVAAGLLGGTSASAQSRGAAPASAQSRDSAYRVRPGDKLFISVWKEEGLAQTAIVRPDGGFTFPLAGELNATRQDGCDASGGDSRPPRALDSGGGRHRRRCRAPRRAHLHHRTGPDARGIHHALSTLDVLQALSMAGGVTAFASPGDIKILRRGAEGQRAIPFDYDAIIRGRDLAQNITLEDGDVVIVP